MKKRMAAAVQTAVSNPTIIIIPRSILSISAMRSGPGVGGTSEWVIDPPAPIARIRSI
jgi:hypothetical protein